MTSPCPRLTRTPHIHCDSGTITNPGSSSSYSETQSFHCTCLFVRRPKVGSLPCHVIVEAVVMGYAKTLCISLPANTNDIRSSFCTTHHRSAADTNTPHLVSQLYASSIPMNRSVNTSHLVTCTRKSLWTWAGLNTPLRKLPLLS